MKAVVVNRQNTSLNCNIYTSCEIFNEIQLKYYLIYFLMGANSKGILNCLGGGEHRLNMRAKVNATIPEIFLYPKMLTPNLPPTFN